MRGRTTTPMTIATLVLLAGCSLPQRPAPVSGVALPAAFEQQVDDGTQMTPQALAHWWTVWRDPVLDRLIADALAANGDIAIARARMDEARALAAIAESRLLPTVGAEGGALAGAGDWRLERSGIVQLLPNPGAGFDAYSAGIAADWEPDLFGGRADDAASARASAAAVEEQLAGARMIVAAEVALSYLEAEGLQRRLAVLDGAIAALEQMTAYVEARFQAGQAAASDLARSRERLLTAKADRAPLLDRIDLRRRRLAVLCGHTPEAAAALPAPGSFALPPAPAGQLPSQVLERRPDIRGRADLVRAQSAALASAETDLLPRFTIHFLGQDGHLGVDGLPGLGGTVGLVGLSANLPIFTAGRIHANIAANSARLDAAAADYDQTVLRALEEIENAYGLRLALDRRAASQDVALDQARRDETATEGLYRGGRKTLQDVIEARLDSLARQDDLSQTQIDQAGLTVRLYLALGGGWTAE